MMFVFDARQADEGRSFFAKRGGGNRIGEKLFDERVTIVSDPAEKNAETAPFNGAGEPVRRGGGGQNGGLKALAYSPFLAMKQGVEHQAGPPHFCSSRRK